MTSQLHLIADLRHGGAQTQLRRLAIGMASTDEAVHVVSLHPNVSASDSNIVAELRDAGVTVHTVGRRFSPDPIAAVQLGRLIRSVQPSQLQTWDAASGELLRSVKWIPLRAIGRPTWTHTVRELNARGQVSIADAELAERADQTVVPAEIVAEELRELGDVEVSISPNTGPDTADAVQTPIDQQVARQTLIAQGFDVQADEPMIVLVTRIDSSDPVKEAIWAADLVRVLHPTVRLYVIGDGPGRMACERFADKATLPNTVHFLGHQANLSNWLAAADVIWATTNAPDALSAETATPVLEALAAGKPVVASLVAAPTTEMASDKTATDQTGQSNTPDVQLVGWNDRAGWTAATDRLLSATLQVSAKSQPIDLQQEPV